MCVTCADVNMHCRRHASMSISYISRWERGAAQVRPASCMSLSRGRSGSRFGPDQDACLGAFNNPFASIEINPKLRVLGALILAKVFGPERWVSTYFMDIKQPWPSLPEPSEVLLTAQLGNGLYLFRGQFECNCSEVVAHSLLFAAGSNRDHILIDTPTE